MAKPSRPPSDPLTGVRRPADFTAAERWFSTRLRQQLEELLEGRCDRVYLLRRYPRQPGRLGVIPTPRRPGPAVRLAVAEKLTLDAIGFMRSDGVAGPVAQSLAPDGSLVEVQSFPTKYPHIVIERTDRFARDGRDPVEITWCLRRVQNQRRQTQLNRLLDAANLAMELVRIIH
jgi:hypothetical protein